MVNADSEKALSFLKNWLDVAEPKLLDFFCQCQYTAEEVGHLKLVFSACNVLKILK